ncbi:MAG: methionyl-tRNA formyltransferase [Candidatus Omnitrophota bacterium]
MKAVFFGSSEFSLYALQACLDFGVQVDWVVTTPDQKKGRGLRPAPTPVKVFAEKKLLNVLTPGTLKEDTCEKEIRRTAPDLFVVSSYGKMIPGAWLGIPSKIALNVHPSLLPKYRGASPIVRPILNGDRETGVSVAEVTPKLDSGDILAQARVALEGEIDAVELQEKLGELSYQVLRDVFVSLKQNTLHRIPQDESAATYAAKVSKEEGKTCFAETAEALSRKIRAFQPWPGVYFFLQKNPIHLLKAKAVNSGKSGKPGTLLEIGKDGGIDVATGNGVIRIFFVKPAGRNSMSAADFIRGQRIQPGVLIGDA